MLTQRLRLLMVLLACCCLADCGTVVPNIKEAWDSDIPAGVDKHGYTIAPIPGAGQIEWEIKSRLYCDLKAAVQATNAYYGGLRIPQDWNAQVSLSLEVDESAALNPGVALNDPLATAMTTFGVLGKAPVTVTTPQTFSLGIGGSLSSTATRTDKFDPTWTIERLSKANPPAKPDVNGDFPLCGPGGPDPRGDPLRIDPLDPDHHIVPATSSPLLIESDLGITDWLLGAMYTNLAIASDSGLRSLTVEEIAAERQALKDYRFKKPQNDCTKSAKDKRLVQGFTEAQTAQIVASGVYASSLVKVFDDDQMTSATEAELKPLQTKLALHPELKDDPELQRNIKQVENEVTFAAAKVASKTIDNDLNNLLALGTVTPCDIATFFGNGGSPTDLQGFLKAGYDQLEIASIIKASKPAAAGSGGGSAGGGTTPKPDTLTLEIKFVIVSSGNVTPTWKLVRVSANTSSTPLFAIGRTRTHDVIITIGPPGQQTANTHLASQIGVSVANALQSTPSSNTFTFPF